MLTTLSFNETSREIEFLFLLVNSDDIRKEIVKKKHPTTKDEPGKWGRVFRKRTLLPPK
jgi:hypothetical protein